MLGLSTCYISETLNDGEELFIILQKLGIEFLELEYRIPESTFLNIKPKLKLKNIKILSIHNFFPFPEEYSHLKPSGDLFLLSSLDKEEREKAIKFTIKTIRTANDLECSAVVLHLGKVEMDSYHKEFCHFYDSEQIDSLEMDLFLKRVKEERESKKQRFLDAVFFSLEKINREAEKQNVFLGVENRYYFNEIPNFEEIGIILNKFSGSNILYWHDIGHGHVQEKLKMQSHQELLKTYSPYILGMHFHDANGYNDHKPPGKGEIDFGWFKEYLKDETKKVLEIHPQASFEDVREGFMYLQEIGYK